MPMAEQSRGPTRSVSAMCSGSPCGPNPKDKESPGGPERRRVSDGPCCKNRQRRILSMKLFIGPSGELLTDERSIFGGREVVGGLELSLVCQLSVTDSTSDESELEFGNHRSAFAKNATSARSGGAEGGPDLPQGAESNWCPCESSQIQACYRLRGAGTLVPVGVCLPLWGR